MNEDRHDRRMALVLSFSFLIVGLLLWRLLERSMDLSIAEVARDQALYEMNTELLRHAE